MCILLENHTHRGEGMRTNIVIDDALMKKAQKLGGFNTKKDTVEAGLKLLVRLKEQAKIKNLKGKLNWEGDLDASREGR